MKSIVFTDGLLIGHPEIDADHEHLVKLIRQWHESHEEGDMPACTAALDHVGKTLKIHFRTEVEVMTELGYKETRDHKRDHAAAWDHFEEIKVQCGTGECRGSECQLSMNKLFYDDLLKSDLDFKGYLQAINYK